VLELGEGKLSRPVLRGPGGRKAAWLLGETGGASDALRGAAAADAGLRGGSPERSASSSGVG